MNRGEPHRLRTGSPEYFLRPSGSVLLYLSISRYIKFHSRPSINFQDLSFRPKQSEWRNLRFQRFTIAKVYPRLFQLGSVAIPTAGVITALAIVIALFTVRMTARRFELDPEKVWDLGILGVLTALFAHA